MVAFSIGQAKDFYLFNCPLVCTSSLIPHSPWLIIAFLLCEIPFDCFKIQKWPKSPPPNSILYDKPLNLIGLAPFFFSTSSFTRTESKFFWFWFWFWFWQRGQKKGGVRLLSENGGNQIRPGRG
jgi:hypothetical protein